MRSSLSVHSEEYRKLANNISDAIFEIDIDFVITYCNIAAVELIGISYDEAIGKTLVDILPAEMQIKMSTIFAMVFETKTERRITIDQFDGDKAYEVSVFPSSVGILVLFKDVTSVVNAEKTNRELKTQLAHSQKMETVGELYAGMAHDFNNMLTIIIGNANLALSLSETESCVDELNEILDASTRAKELVSNVLQFSRNNGYEDISDATDIREVVNNVFGIIKRTYDKKIQITTIISDENIQVDIEKNLIFQAILNVCNNARDAMPEGGNLIISAERYNVEEDFLILGQSVKKGEYCRVCIKDNGTGIPEDLISKISLPFITTKKAGKGTGLGLSMAHQIVGMSGGYIDISSSVGKGTEICIFLPLMNSERCNKVAQSENGKNEVAAGGTEKILVVDDEESILSYCKRALSHHGYGVLTAQNGIDALEIFDANISDISLVMIDINMPGASGIDVAEEIRKLHATVKIVLTSGYNKCDLNNSPIPGDVFFIQKPFTIAQLSSSIRNIIDGEENV